MTLCTLAIDKLHKRYFRHAVGNMLTALFFVLFGGIYEAFSFGVYSNYMIYSFVPLMICGTIILLIAVRDRIPEGRFILPLEMSAITFTVGSAAVGAIEIYGTSNKLTKIYPAAGGILLAAAFITYLTELKKLRYREERES